MPKISVICVTNRKGALEILEDDLSRQTFDDFELILADDLCEEEDDFLLRGEIPVQHFKPRGKTLGDVWNLNKAYNDCLSRAAGELLVFLQDYIWIPANGLERFWEMYEAYPDNLVTGVGHKAKDGLAGISEVDARVYGEEEVAPGNFSHWELNWASCPKALMPHFNEEMDQFYGGENAYIGRVCQLKGVSVVIDRRNQCIGYSQEVCGGRPEDWEENHSNKKSRLTQFLDKLQ